jgi:L-iditol 2-dehydrogenase
MTRMRAAVLSEPGRIDVEERERPEPAPDEALVAVERVGICGSDLHYYEHGRIGEYVVDAPLVLGHESAGVVEAVGSAVDDLEPGDRVAMEPGVPCRRCRHCRSGHYNRCPDVAFMATPPDDGAFREYVAWPADLCHRLPDGVSATAGALCEPVSVGVHATRRGGVGPGDAVFVSGAGPIGLLAHDAARAAGATRTLVSDVVTGKLARARDRRATATVDASEGDPADAARELATGGVDVAIEASGTHAGIHACLAAVRRGGAVVLVGLPADGEVPVDVHELVDGELDLRGSFRFANTYPAALDLVAHGAVDPVGLVDFTAPLAGTGAALERALNPEVVKGVVEVR